MPATNVAARNKRNRQKGQRWQSELREGFRNNALDAEELKLAGREDEGDIVVRTGYQNSRLIVPDFLVIEAKDATMDVATFVREAVIEADHYATHRRLDRGRVTGIAVVKRRGKNWRESYVMTTLGEYMKLDTP